MTRQELNTINRIHIPIYRAYLKEGLFDKADEVRNFVWNHYRIDIGKIA